MIVSDSPPSTLSLLRRIWGHLSGRRLQLAVLLLVMLASGLAELVSLGAVLPFLAVLSNPQQLWQLLLLPATMAFAVAALGWRALIPLAEVLASTVAQYRQALSQQLVRM